MVRIGSLFAGIGGFELGLERAIPNSETIWQVEQDKFCQRVLRKHWPQSKIYNDVREVSSHNLEPVDLLCGGFPCQNISVAGKGEGLNGKKSGLWWEMHRIIRDIRPRVIVLENVSAITIRGGLEVIGSLTEIGYLCEWGIISARQFGAPHLRKRWFCVAHSDGRHIKKQFLAESIKETRQSTKKNIGAVSISGFGYWERCSAPSPICRVDDGISDRVAKLRALGNAIVPQCSEYIGRLIYESGVLYG
jgi:DNA (cytosine-5)-methyltransferase 1